MFGFRSRQPAVLSHWFTVVDEFRYSTQQFYQAIEEELEVRQVPGLAISRVTYREGGALSHGRMYLRLSRERFAFDVCAAPFGQAYFFSLRFVEIPRPGWLGPAVLIGLIAILARIARVAVEMRPVEVGLQIGITAITAAMMLAIGWLGMVALSYALRPSVAKSAAGPADLDGFLLRLPIVGYCYERFRKDTYYREDTRLIYHALITDIVKKKVEEVTAVKGVKLIRVHERNPILSGPFKPATLKPDGNAAAAA